MKILFAPMEGIAHWLYRSAQHACFDGADEYFLPFWSPRGQSLTHREQADVLPENNAGMKAVPQILSNSSEDFLWAADKLKALGTPFAPSPPETYYEMLDGRLPGHGEPVDELRQRGILLDGSTEHGDPRLLLQIFSQTMIGPVFFEFIQRKKDEGFGEGNFTALFKSMELDQIRRGALTVEEPAE